MEVEATVTLKAKNTAKIESFDKGSDSHAPSDSLHFCEIVARFSQLTERPL